MLNYHRCRTSSNGQGPPLWSEVRSVGVTLSLLSSTLPTWILLTSRKRCSASCWTPSNVKRTRGRSRSLMKAPSSFRVCTLVHLSLKPGETSTKLSGGSPRITSRRIVDVGIPAPMISAGEIPFLESRPGCCSFSACTARK